MTGLTTGVVAIAAGFARTTELEASTSNAVTVTVDPRDGAEFRADSRTSGSRQLPAAAAPKAGGHVVVWASQDQDGSNRGIYGRRFTLPGIL